jgi:RNA polymerase sigma-70 factor (ECF subfamily)
MSPPASAETDDLALVRAAQSGDRAAMEVLLGRHYDRIAKLCRRLVNHAEDAADCTQDALLAVVRGLAGFDGRSTFSSWSHRVATNTCLDHLRQRTRRPLTSELDESAELLITRSTAPTHGRRTSEQVVDRLDIDDALARLPLEFRVPVVLRDLYGLDYAEIAQICEVPGGTVRSRIARGRAALEEVLAPGNQSGVADVEGGDHDGS